jgi:hypothetical protein
MKIVCCCNWPTRCRLIVNIPGKAGGFIILAAQSGRVGSLTGPLEGEPLKAAVGGADATPGSDGH